VFTKDGIRILIDIIIVDPMRAYLLLQFCTIQRFIAFDETQAKKKNYHNQHLIDQFLPLAIELFGCLHKHANMFLHNCVNAIWSLKRLKGLHLSTFVTFFCKEVLVTLQMM
jgi:hypothetical protein